MSTVIKVENLSKSYRLGQIGGKRLVDDVNRWWARFRGKEDPLTKVGFRSGTGTGGDEIIWSLQGVSFEVNQGEVLGIVGRNGAGKSTLLKILSRVTAPTRGHIKLRGRIASLLEVGTGFHPELTGRENVFLNAAILGMTKAEVRSRFDEIVSFSEVEQFIDTPVKRYSSGMYVRLAFAVAAHLRPEILIVDEVLAVGDAEFQKKCLGKLKDVSINEGRTVLFVSHNMSAVKTLCTKAVLLDKGKMLESGSADYIISKYINARALGEYLAPAQTKPGASFRRIWFSDSSERSIDTFNCGETIIMKAEVNNPHGEALGVDVAFFDNMGNKLWNFTPEAYAVPPLRSAGSNEIELQFDVPEILANELFVHAGIRNVSSGSRDYVDHVSDGLRVFIRSKSGYIHSGHGLIRCPVRFRLQA